MKMAELSRRPRRERSGKSDQNDKGARRSAKSRAARRRQARNRQKPKMCYPANFARCRPARSARITSASLSHFRRPGARGSSNSTVAALPHPFMRPAIDAKGAASIDRFRVSLGENIEAAVRRRNNGRARLRSRIASAGFFLACQPSPRSSPTASFLHPRCRTRRRCSSPSRASRQNETIQSMGRQADGRFCKSIVGRTRRNIRELPDREASGSRSGKPCTAFAE